MPKHMSHVLVLTHIYTISAHSPGREGLAEPDVAEVVFCFFSQRDMYWHSYQFWQTCSICFMIERLLSRLLITICIYVYLSVYMPLSQELCRLLCAPPRGLGSPLCRTSVSCADLHLTLLTTMNNFKPSVISCVCTIWAINSAMASYQNDVNVMPSFCQMIMVAYRSVKSCELMWRLLVFDWFACRIL